MGTVDERIEPRAARWTDAQPRFFVATAPLSAVPDRSGLPGW